MAKYFSVYLLEGGFEANFKAKDYKEALKKADKKLTEAGVKFKIQKSESHEPTGLLITEISKKYYKYLKRGC
jgi:5-hydroxyisourate hydrolase-like protein (transthyretin family)